MKLEDEDYDPKADALIEAYANNRYLDLDSWSEGYDGQHAELRAKLDIEERAGHIAAIRISELLIEQDHLIKVGQELAEQVIHYVLSSAPSDVQGLLHRAFMWKEAVERAEQEKHRV